MNIRRSWTDMIRRGGRPYAFALLLLASLAVVGVLGRWGGRTSASEPVPPKLGVNLIAYADRDGQIMTAQPDGSSPVKLSPDLGFFTWPVWSPDSSQLAFSGIPLEGNAPGDLTLYHVDLDDGDPRAIFENAPGMGPILNRMPHYPIWAPDSGRLAFMASAPEGLTLLILDPRKSDAPGVLIRRAPLYVSWSGDSRRLVVHGGPDHFVADVDGEVSVRSLDISAPAYRVPAWWPSGDKIGYVRQDELGRTGLYVADVDSGEREMFQQFEGAAAFLWSPDGSLLAVAHSGSRSSFGYQGVALVTPKGARLSVEIRAEVLAFFWSPDSRKLAYVVPSGTRSVLRWMILDLATEERWPIADFTPSLEQLSIFQFFDQFGYSHSQWSPASDALVFAGVIPGDGVSASLGTQQVSQIFVISTEPFSSAEPIAEGIVAVWSPR